jgi:hypothetical protein
VSINLDPVSPVSSQALLTLLGIPVDEYYTPTFFPSYSYQVPRWRTTDTIPRPTGSIWNNSSPVNNGIALSFKKYNSALASFISQAVPGYADDASAIYGLDPSGGGKNIPTGTTFLAAASVSNEHQVTSGVYEILERLR